MFKRLFWLTVGMTIGFGTSFWLYRLVQETIARYTPERMVDDVSLALGNLRSDLRAALEEGRAAARETEAELRARLDARS